MSLHKIRLMARRCGIETFHANIWTVPELRLAHFLKLFNVDVVLDVGANAGQFAEGLRSAGFRRKIISFEALPDVQRTLALKARHDSEWMIPAPMAISDYDGRANFHVSTDSVSSSLLSRNKNMDRVASGFEMTSTIETDVRRLDTYFKPEGRVFLKIDTQGTEAHVLRGAEGIMDSVVGIQLEMSFSPLYEGQNLLFKDIWKQVEAQGFDLWDIGPAAFDRSTGRIVQCDGVFFRRNMGVRSGAEPSTT